MNDKTFLDYIAPSRLKSPKYEELEVIDDEIPENQFLIESLWALGATAMVVGLIVFSFTQIVW